MPGLRTAGALWVTAGVVCVGLLIVVFLGENVKDLGALLRDPIPPAVVLAASVVALSLGVWFIRRPGPDVLRWSTVAGVAWLIVFGSWAFIARDDAGPLTSTLMIGGFGVAGALVAYGSRKQVAP